MPSTRSIPGGSPFEFRIESEPIENEKNGVVRAEIHA